MFYLCRVLYCLSVIKASIKLLKSYKFRLSEFADEEVGGTKGMAPFVKCPEFSKLNVGFALDEGLTSADEEIMFMYAERAICRKNT